MKSASLQCTSSRSGAPPRILVDALNVAYWCGDPPSLCLPLALAAGLWSDGREAVLYFDASARYRLGADAGVYAALVGTPDVAVEAPSGKRADGLMLRDATRAGACVVSRDRYRDYRKRYRRLIDDPARLLSGAVSQEQLMVPGLALCVPLPPSAQAAWALLLHAVGRPALPAKGE